MTTDYQTAIAIKQHSVSISCGIVTVYLQTDRHYHLWMLQAVIPPLINEEPPVQKPPTRAHRLSYRLVVDRGLEQQEDGQTTDHTFVFPLPFFSGRLYYMFIWTSNDARKIAQTPIFCFDIVQTVQAIETWPDGFPGIWGWSSTINPGASLTSSPGQVVLSAAGNAVLASIGINLATIPGYTPSAPCDSFLAIQLSSGPRPIDAGHAVVELDQVRASPAYFSNAFILVRSQASVSWGTDDIYANNNAGSGPSGYGNFSASAGQLFFSAQNGMPPTSGAVDQSVPWTNLSCIAFSGNALDPTPSSSLTVGHVAIGTISPSVVRRDRQWRSLANPVFEILDLQP